jgi:hypothetical protein
MCLILHSDGHLTVKMMYEQIWPRVDERGALAVLECYDFVLRSHTPEEISSLHILSPQTLVAKGDRFDVLPNDVCEEYNWIFQMLAHDRKDHNKARIQFAAPFGEPPLLYGVTQLRPSIRKAAWLRTANDRMIAFQSTGMTMAEVALEDGPKIKKFDPEHPDETTYWLRLAFEPKIQHLTETPIAFAPRKQSVLSVQPCSILCPQQVLYHLSSQLKLMETDSRTVLGKGAKVAQEEVFDKVFEKPKTSARIEEHRISLATGPEFLVLNTSIEGDCGFVSVQLLKNADRKLTRTWFTGAKYYPLSDPLTTASIVYTYLKHWAHNEAGAKSKEAVSAALSSHSHENISHVVEALVTLGFVKAVGQGLYYVHGAPLPENELFLQEVRGSAEIDLKRRDREIRDILYGPLPVPDRGGDLSRFRRKGFRIFNDLGF